MKTITSPTFLCLAWLATALPLGAQTPAYTVIDLGTLGGATSNAQAVNNLGQVAGYANTADGYTFATLFSVAFDGTVSRLNLGALGGTYSTAQSLNDSGAVVGFAQAPSSNGVAALFKVSGGTVTATNLSPGQPFTATSAAQVDGSGLIVGQSQNVLNSSTTAESWTYDGSTVTNTHLGGSGSTFANGNSRASAVSPSGGNVVGTTTVSSGGFTIRRAVRFLPSGLDLGTLGGTNSAANGVNSADLVAGSSELTTSSTDFHAATFSVGSGNAVTRVDLGTLGGVNSAAYAVNVFNQVVGASQYTGGGSAYAAFIYTAAGGMKNLNALIGANSAVTALGANTNTAGLNEWGQIATTGTVAGQTHAVLLNPTTNPNSTLSSSFNSSYRNIKLVAGMSYGVTPATTNISGLASTVSLLGGTAGSGGAGAYGLNRDVGEQFGSANISGVPLASSGVLITGTGADTYVVQLSYSESAAASAVGASENDLRLCYFNAGVRFLNAVDGNVGGAPFFAGNRAYNPATDFHLGTYGIDTVNNVAWAVVNQENSYAVTLDPNVLKRVKTVSRSGTTTTMTADSYTGHSYQLQRATGAGGPYTNSGSALTGSNGTTLSFSFNEGTTKQAFYRLVVGP